MNFRIIITQFYIKVVGCLSNCKKLTFRISICKIELSLIKWGGTWSPGKTDGGRWWERYLVCSLYVMDTMRTREVRTMAIRCLRGESRREGTVEGCTVDMPLCWGHVVVLVTAVRLPPHGVANTIVAILHSLRVLWPLSVPPDLWFRGLTWPASVCLGPVGHL